MEIESQYKILVNSKKLIICFGGMKLKMYGILPFEFLNYLSKTYENEVDLYFFVDRHQCWYHKGFEGITSNINDTIEYLNKIIINGNYNKVIFMGISAGGYASILFGSLCNVSNVVSFIPVNNITNPINLKYKNLNNVINKTTKYLIYGDSNFNDNDIHNIKQYKKLESFSNVTIEIKNRLSMKIMRDKGEIKEIIDKIFNDT